MNIFVVDACPQQAARDLCNVHVRSQLKESAQMLCLPFEKAPYKPSHKNHPCSVWVRTSRENYLWLVQHGLQLGAEYFAAYRKVHKSLEVVMWCLTHLEQLSFPQTGLSPFAQAMPEKYRSNNAVEAYRRYYQAEKTFASWDRGRTPPSWWQPGASLQTTTESGRFEIVDGSGSPSPS